MSLQTQPEQNDTSQLLNPDDTDAMSTRIVHLKVITLYFKLIRMVICIVTDVKK